MDRPALSAFFVRIQRCKAEDVKTTCLLAYPPPASTKSAASYSNESNSFAPKQNTVRKLHWSMRDGVVALTTSFAKLSEGCWPVPLADQFRQMKGRTWRLSCNRFSDKRADHVSGENDVTRGQCDGWTWCREVREQCGRLRARAATYLPSEMEHSDHVPTSTSGLSPSPAPYLFLQFGPEHNMISRL